MFCSFKPYRIKYKVLDDGKYELTVYKYYKGSQEAKDLISFVGDSFDDVFERYKRTSFYKEGHE